MGVEYASKAGYDSAQLASFFETLERMNPGSDRSGLPGWFSTHPSPQDRVQVVRVRAKEWQERLGNSGSFQIQGGSMSNLTVFASCATRSSDTLENALRSLSVPNEKLKEMALLNGGNLNQIIPANTLIKVVEKGS